MGLMDKLSTFIAPPDEDEEEVIEYDEEEVETISQYEAPKAQVKRPSSDVKMVLFEPRDFDEAVNIAHELMAKRAAVVNLHKLQRDNAQRTIDFLTGVVVALNGEIQKIGLNTILCTPNSISVDGSINLENED